MKARVHRARAIGHAEDTPGGTAAVKDWFHSLTEGRGGWNLPKTDMILPAPQPEPVTNLVVRYSESEIPTAQGPIRLVVYREIVRGKPDPGCEHVAMVVGDPASQDAPLVRVHSECITSEVFGSLKCDCKEQLDSAVARMHQAGHGLIVYLRQEGRGIGLGNKIRAYALQARGADTISANHQLGFAADLRTYDIAAGMLLDLGIKKVALLTNNPLKIQGLEEFGIEVTRREPIEIEPTPHSEGYLTTKRARMGHLLVQVPDEENP